MVIEMKQLITWMNAANRIKKNIRLGMNGLKRRLTGNCARFYSLAMLTNCIELVLTNKKKEIVILGILPF